MIKHKKETVLVVDDTPENITMLLTILDEYDVIPSLNGKNALKLIESESIDIVLLDIVMPDLDGYEVCKQLKSNPKTQHIPVIFITVKSDEDSIEKAYDAGAVDYTIKPFRPKEIRARVKTSLALSKSLRDLEFLASYDTMTNIYNRRKFFELGENIFKENSNDIYTIMIDIDHFKNINDTYGHSTGDKVIKNVTSLISQNLPDSFIFGRIGGEEFAIIAKSDNKDNLFGLMENIRIDISKSIVKEEIHNIVCSVSYGLSQKKHSDSIDILLKRSDEALYEAKKEGRNRGVIK